MYSDRRELRQVRRNTERHPKTQNKRCRREIAGTSILRYETSNGGILVNQHRGNLLSTHNEIG